MRTLSILWSTLISGIIIANSGSAADLVWIGGTGNWNSVGNWSPAQVPTATDNAWLTNGGSYTVMVPAGSVATVASLTVGGASGTQILAIDRATLTLNGASLINANGQLNLSVSQSVVTGPGNLVVKGTLNWINGTISGTGTATIDTSGVLAIGSGGVTLGRTLNNGGTGSWAGGNFTISAGNAFNNLAGATFDVAADGRLTGTATTPIGNSGLLRLLSGSAGTVITAPLNNNGTLQVMASTLSLNLGGSHSGTFNNALGATLNLGGGNHVLNSGSSVTGTGTVNLSGSVTLTASGTFEAGTLLSVASGTATLAPTCHVTGTTLSISGNGVVVFDSAGPVGAVNLSAGTLGGTSPITVTAALTLGGGTVTNGLVTAGGGLAISGNTTLSGTKLVNPATALWTGGNITGANGAVISNLVGAAFINTFDGNLSAGSGATPLFVNAGLFAKTNGTAALGTTAVNFQFFNTGTVEVRTNTLRYAFNQQTAGLTLLDGGGLSAQAQPIQLLGGSLVGTGLVTLANAQNVINSSSISPGSPLGELDITGNYQQTPAGVLNIELGGYVPGTNFDLLTVTAGGGGGVATLGGTLAVSLADGFSPTNGASFTFLTASSRVGSFAAFDYPSNDIGMQLSYAPASVTVKVTNLKPTVTNPISDPAPVTYGSAFSFQFAANTFTDPDGDTLSYSALGLPPGIAFNPSTRTFSGTAAQAGIFPVTLTATDSGTPSLAATTAFTLTVAPAPLTVAAQLQSKIYGTPDPPLTFTVSGLLLGDAPGSVLTGALGRAAGETVAGGPYAVTQGTLAANSNYVMAFTASTLSITPAPLLVSADSKSKVYGAVDPLFTAGYLGFVDGETPAVLGGALSFARAPGENVGAFAITPGGLTSDNYAITFASGTLTITPAALAVTAENKAKTYGSPDPTFTVAYSGLVNGDTASILRGVLAFARAPGENVGNYSITPGGLSSPNYSISFSPGTLTISKAVLAVTAQNKAKVYGSPDPPFTVTYAGLVSGDTSAVLGGSLVLSRAPGEDAGAYAITPSGLTSGNYEISFHPGALTIAPAALSVTAEDKSKAYGSPDPVFTVTYTGLVNGDTASSLGGILAFSRAPGENVGGYPVTPSGLASANYLIAFNPGALTITKAPLTATAEDKSKTYGSPDPAFTVSYHGFVNGDTAAALGGSLVFTRSPGEDAGSYAITPSGVVSANYVITFNPGTLSVLRAPLAITADSKTKTYGSIDPSFTATFDGFLNGETAAVLGGTLSFTRAAGETVGNYAVTPGGLTSRNYAITFNSGTLTISKAALSVVADSKTKSYGAPDPAFTASYAGFVNNETPAVLGGALALTRAPGENVGGYPINPAGLTSANYTITYAPGTLTITPATLVVVAQPKTKTYGAADPALTFTITGLRFTDTQSSVLTGSLGRAAGETVAGSPYPITQGTLTASGNYTINFIETNLTITPAALSVSADSKTKIFGTADPAFTVTYAGFVSGETSAVLTGTLTFARAPGEGIGRYTITPGGLLGANYVLTFNPGLLTIVAPAPVLLPLTIAGTSGVRVSWNSVSNATYRVQVTLDLLNWTDLPGDITATGAVSSRIDPLSPANHFYRVQVIP